MIFKKMKPEDIRDWSSAVEFLLQELTLLKGRLNIAEENVHTLRLRDDIQRRRIQGLENEMKAQTTQYLSNMDLIDNRFAKIRDRLDRLEGKHVSR